MFISLTSISIFPKPCTSSTWKYALESFTNSEGKCIRVLIEEFDNYIQNGWKQGRIDRDKRKRIKDKTEEERIESLKKRNPKGYVVCKNTQTGEVKRILKNDITVQNPNAPVVIKVPIW